MQQSFEEIMTSIKERRKSLGLTQLQLAEMCGIKQSNYSRMESGRQMPSLEPLLNILSHLHMDIDLVRRDYNVYKDANDEEPFLTIEKPRRLKKTSMNSTPEKNIMPWSDFEIQELRRAKEDALVHELYMNQQIENLTAELIENYSYNIKTKTEVIKTRTELIENITKCIELYEMLPEEKANLAEAKADLSEAKAELAEEKADLAEAKACLSQYLKDKARLAEENADLRRQLKEMGIDA